MVHQNHNPLVPRSNRGRATIYTVLKSRYIKHLSRLARGFFVVCYKLNYLRVTLKNIKMPRKLLRSCALMLP